MASEGVVDADVRRCPCDAARARTGASPLATTIARRSLFPPGMGPIISWAEQHRTLAEALHMLGEMFEARARAQASFASTVFTVMTVLMILFSMSAVIGGVFIPLIQTIQKLSG